MIILILENAFENNVCKHGSYFVSTAMYKFEAAQTMETPVIWNAITLIMASL